MNRWQLKCGQLKYVDRTHLFQVPNLYYKKIVNLIGLFQVQQTHQFSLSFNSSGVVLRDADVLALVLPLQVVGDQVAGVLLDGPTGKERKKGALVTSVNCFHNQLLEMAFFWIGGGGGYRYSSGEGKCEKVERIKNHSTRWESNPELPNYQACALPLCYECTRNFIRFLLIAQASVWQ